MRILFVNNYYPPHEAGGYEQLCRDVVERLAARGHTTQVLTSTYGVEARSLPNEPGIHRRLRLQPDFKSRLNPVLQFLFTRRQGEAYDCDCLRGLAAQFVPDVISIWNLQWLPRSMALVAEAIPGAAVAYWLAGSSPAEPDDFWDYWTYPPHVRSTTAPIKSAMSRLALGILRAEGKPVRPQMCHVAVVSEYMRRQGIAKGTLPPHTRVIYNGIELEQFSRPVPTKVGTIELLQAGRVSEDKGVHTAVEAVGHLARDHGIDNLHFTIAGSGPARYLAFLQQLVRQYGLEDKVSFLGWLPRDKMPELMSSSHILLLPTTHQEPFARVVLEAMASGLAVVGTPTGGTAELLQHEITGLIFTPGDSWDLAAQIRRLSVDPGLRQRVAAQGQKLVLERFSLTRMVNEIECFLEEAAQARTLGLGRAS